MVLHDNRQLLFGHCARSDSESNQEEISTEHVPFLLALGAYFSITRLGLLQTSFSSRLFYLTMATADGGAYR